MNRDLVARHLVAGERVIWRETPPAAQLATSKAFTLVFALLWAGFAWVWTSLVLVTIVPAFGKGLDVFIGVPIIFVAFGLFFSAIGAGLVWSAACSVAASWATEYVLTDRRLLIVEGDCAHSYGALAFMTMRNEGDAERGVIAFDFGPSGRSGVGFNAHLVGVRDPAGVEALIRQTLKPQLAGRD